MTKFFKHRSQKGFTLIELLVVIAIIGILSSVVLASLNSARVKARDARRVADLKQIQVALELYYDANSHYPAATLSSALAPTYISAVPTDPLDSTAYAYAYSAASNPTGYHLGASLEQSGSQTSLLAGDRDMNSVTTPNWSATGGFNGADTGSCAATPVSSRYCYDISNQ